MQVFAVIAWVTSVFGKSSRLFLLNYGQATGEDIYAMAQDVRLRVQELFRRQARAGSCYGLDEFPQAKALRNLIRPVFFIKAKGGADVVQKFLGFFNSFVREDSRMLTHAFRFLDKTIVH